MTEEKLSLRKKILTADPDFYKKIDKNLLIFCREIRRELRDEGHVVIGITGYPGKGKSNTVALLGSMIDERYDFEKNICFIPSSKEIQRQYFSLPMYSFYHIDEASRGLHKHKWHDKVQQKLNQLYDTEREGHFLCTALIMPRFQNFTENFRNFMITYWIDVPEKGIAVFYKKDQDKDAKDPWHMDENYKKKLKNWRNKRIFERSLGDKIRAEQSTDCYWFYCKVPPIPKAIWEEYQGLKRNSRTQVEEEPEEKTTLTAKERKEQDLSRRIERENRAMELLNKGLTRPQISIEMGVGLSAVADYIRVAKARSSMAKEEDKTILNSNQGVVIPEKYRGFDNTTEK